MARQTTEEFLAKAKAVWGDEYDYSLTVYRGPLRRVTIICPTHGPFEQLPYNHLAGHGCRQCKFEADRLTTEQFIERARRVHGDSYDYSQTVYHNYRTAVMVICPTHGVFQRNPTSFLDKGRGCPVCCRKPRPKRGPTLKLEAEELIIIRWALRTYRP
jgi:hypothetical protein